VAIRKHGPERRDQQRRQLHHPVAAVPVPGSSADRDGIPPKLALRLEEQGKGIAPHHHTVAKRGGFSERSGGGEQPKRNPWGAAMEM
jgi:hypothetical protein